MFNKVAKGKLGGLHFRPGPPVMSREGAPTLPAATAATTTAAASAAAHAAANCVCVCVCVYRCHVAAVSVHLIGNAVAIVTVTVLFMLTVCPLLSLLL